MKSVILPAYNPNLIRALIGMKVEEFPLPLPSKDEVVIKITAAPCNPSDIAFLRGGYNIKKPTPCIPGFEGTGIIKDLGAGVSKDLLNKKVSCFIQIDESGTWSEYAIASIKDCILLDEEMPDDQAACFAVNPFTAYGLFEIVKSSGAKAFIQNAANGQVGKFLRILAKRENMAVINIVRKKEHFKQLTEQGEIAIDGMSENFTDTLKELVNKYDAKICFDAVGGEQTGLLINAMPADSELVLYGGLSGQEISQIDPMGIIFDRKTISGFNLMDWKSELKKGEFEEISEYLQAMFIEGVLKTEIAGSYCIEDFLKGIREYIGNMSAGKILIKP